MLSLLTGGVVGETEGQVSRLAPEPSEEATAWGGSGATCTCYTLGQLLLSSPSPAPRTAGQAGREPARQDSFVSFTSGG